MNVRAVSVVALLAFVALPHDAVAQPGRKAESQLHWPMQQIQGFHVVLVVGETQPAGSSPGEELPAGARKALADMREFLPYKHYRVLDAQWSSCCSGGKSRVSGRLQGVSGAPGPNNALQLLPRVYLFSVTATSGGRSIETRFTLVGEDSSPSRDAADEAGELERRLKNLKEDLATMEHRLAQAKRRVEVGIASALEGRELHDQHTQLQREIEAVEAQIARVGRAGGTPVMDSSFSMDAGETVVVGTSRLGGDRALIALVTAARRSGGGSR